MTLILLDGCEDVSAFLSSAGSPSIISGGRFQNCFNIPSGASVTYNIASAQESDTITMGFAFKLTSLATAAQPFDFRSDGGATEHNRLTFLANGGLTFGRTTNVLFTSPAALITTNVWYYLEVQCKLHDTTGAFTINLNGSQIANVPTADTKNAGTKTTYDQIRLLGQTSTSGILFDDIYVMTGTGDSFLGPIVVETLLPNGNGSANQWVGSDGNSTDNYLLVDDAVSPLATDYTYTGTVGHQDVYAMSNLSHTDGTIVAVCHSAFMQRIDAATPMNVKLINNRTIDYKSVALPVGTTYRSYEYVLLNDPESTLPWTIANVNALQSGVELA